MNPDNVIKIGEAIRRAADVASVIGKDSAVKKAFSNYPVTKGNTTFIKGSGNQGMKDTVSKYIKNR